MSHAKNQHYVARLYLRRFAYEEGKNPHVYAFDKTTRRTIRPSIKNIASELHFYEEKDTGVERMLGRVESEFTPVYQRLREAPTMREISSDDRVVTALFLATQMVRTQEFREGVKSINSQLGGWIERFHKDMTSFPELTEQECRTIQARAIVNSVPEITEVIAAMKWIRFTNLTSMPFWTSDHPINLYNPRPAGLQGNVGLKCRGIQVFFPLSPTQALCLCDPIDYSGLPSDGATNDVENVKFQNHLQLRESTRFLFSRVDDFALAQQILKREPESGDPHRIRMQATGLDVP